MADKTEIAWCDSTFNPWIGCTKVGPGCDNCYAEREFDHRHHRAKWGAGQERARTSAKNWNLPLRWNRQHDEFFAAHGRRRRVFCASLADVFDNEVPERWRMDLFSLIAQTPNLDWLILTKRIGNAERMMAEARQRALVGLGGQWPWENVWLGATVVNQAEADRDIPKLLDVPARVRWLSMEPLLGRVDLLRHLWKCCGNHIPGHPGDGWMQPPDPPECCGDPEPSGLNWIVVGGESGPKARPMHPGWARRLRDQCAAAGVPFFMKQLSGEKGEPVKDIALFPSDLQVREYPNAIL